MSAGDQILNIKLSKPISRLAKINAGLNDIIKRLFDIVISAIVLLLSAPFFVLIAIAIKRGSPGLLLHKPSQLLLLKPQLVEP